MMTVAILASALAMGQSPVDFDADAALAITRSRAAPAARPVTPAGPTSAPSTDAYAVAYRESLRDKKPIVIWIGTPAVTKGLENCIHVEADAFPEVKGRGVIVGRPNGTVIYRVGAIPASLASAETIRAAAASPLTIAPAASYNPVGTYYYPPSMGGYYSAYYGGDCAGGNCGSMSYGGGNFFGGGGGCSGGSCGGGGRRR